MSIVRVAVENTAYSFDKAFDYKVPDSLEASLQRGSAVAVPFGRGNSARAGFVLEKLEKSAEGEAEIKYITDVLGDIPPLSDEQIKLALWLKDRTFCTLYDAVKAMLPAGLTYRPSKLFCAERSFANLPVPDNEDERRLLAYILSKNGEVRDKAIRQEFGFKDDRVAESLVKRGYLSVKGEMHRKTGDLKLRMARLSAGAEYENNISGLSDKQKKVIELLRDIGEASVKEILYFTGYSQSVISTLNKRGLLELFESEEYRNPYPDVNTQPQLSEITLTDEQNEAYKSLIGDCKKGGFSVSLLYGVTGSGKTKVYMKVMDEVIKEKRGVILMVPEIALTPQMISILHERYGKLVAVFHSALSMGERLDEWKRVKNKDALIAVGTRSAVFAPFDDLGLIIIDEEQESTYKSDAAPRYNAKDVAKFRCAYHDSQLILASATPSVESFSAAVRGKYSLCVLKKRYGNAVLPEVETVDMGLERRRGNGSELSGRMVEALKKNIEDKKQSILLINRRGYNTYASCVECGHTMTCPSCSIPMTYHHANGRLMCHYCGYTAAFTVRCPACGNNSLHYFGFGTQKIEDELQNLLPGARILRMDTDTTMSRFAHEKKLESFSKGEYDILVGTQMVAKGLDFENVTLVGVISVDQQLYNDDYRSLERAFDLLMQVVGRSGRGKYPGKALIQTLTPENEIIKLAAEQNYRAFFDTEIEIRKALVYPPYCDICAVNFSSEDELIARSASKAFLGYITSLAVSGEYNNEKMIVLGPMQARVPKINNKYRYRLILKVKNTALFRKMIAEILIKIGKDPRFSRAAVYPDMNPETLL